MTLQQLREKRANLIAEMRRMLDAATADGNRELTAAEATDYAAKEKEAGVLRAKIQRLESLEEAEESLEAAAPAAGTRGVRGTATNRVPPAPGAPAAREFSSLGEFFHAVRFNRNDPRLGDPVEHEAHGDSESARRIRAEQRMDDGVSGGYMVPTQFRNDLMEVAPTDQVMRPRSVVIPPGDPPDGAITIPALDQGSTQNMYGGVVMQWTGEGGAKPATGFNLRNITLAPQEISGYIPVTDKLLRNWAAAGSLIGRQLRGALNAAQDVAFIQGNGVAKPLGFLNSAATAVINRTTGGTVVYADLLAMQEVLLMNGGAPFWTITQRVATKLRLMQDPAGHYIWIDNARDGGTPTLLGLPVVITDRIPTLGNKGDISLVNGANYLIKDGSGPFVAMSEHVQFLNNKTVIKAFTNVDGQPWLRGPIKSENGELKYGFVTLL